jgi:ATP-dependent DNA ligase
MTSRVPAISRFHARSSSTNCSLRLPSGLELPYEQRISLRYPAVVEGLGGLPDEAVIDGEVVAFDEDGRPSFNVLQNYTSSSVPVLFYAFDVMVLRGKNLMSETLERRQLLLEQAVLPKLREPVRYAAL